MAQRGKIDLEAFVNWMDDVTFRRFPEIDMRLDVFFAKKKKNGNNLNQESSRRSLPR